MDCRGREVMLTSPLVAGAELEIELARAGKQVPRIDAIRVPEALNPRAADKDLVAMLEDLKARYRILVLTIEELREAVKVNPRDEEAQASLDGQLPLERQLRAKIGEVSELVRRLDKIDNVKHMMYKGAQGPSPFKSVTGAAGKGKARAAGASGSSGGPGSGAGPR